jgi:hypothetical protein
MNISMVESPSSISKRSFVIILFGTVADTPAAVFR